MALTPDTQSASAQRLYNAGRLAEAGAAFDALIRANPRNAHALLMLGTIHLQMGNFAESERLLEASIAVDGKRAVTHNNRAIALTELKRYDEAVRAFDRAIALDREYAEAYSNRGNALRFANRFEDALRSYDRAIMLKPDLLGAHANRGEALSALGRFAEALISCERDIVLNPSFPDAYYARGNAQRDLGQAYAALDSYSRAIALRPTYAEALYSRGMIYFALHRSAEALADFRRAIEIRPLYADAYTATAQLLYNLGQGEEALVHINQALAINPSFADGHNCRGNILTVLKRFPEALASYDEAVALAPEYAFAHGNRGVVLKHMERISEALLAFDRAIELDPDFEIGLGDRFHAKLLLCDWSNFDADMATIKAKIDAGKMIAVPWVCLPMPLGAEREKRAIETYSKIQFPQIGARPALIRKPDDAKIKIGYFSADFFDHATALLMAGMIEAHDRERFEVVGFSLGGHREDSVRARLSRGFDTLFEVGAQSDEAIVAMAREAQIDIAVDLKGHTQNARTSIFARGLAPVQASYIGFPGTMGAPFIDYLVADPVLIPPAHRGFYTEKIAYLPDSYQVNDSKRAPMKPSYSRTEFGLSEAGFVFCSFNNNYKITPDVFDIWMRLLQQVEGSLLWVFEGNRGAGANLRMEAQKRGVAPERLIFAPRMDAINHLARHVHADLFLDTFNCNAHTTASDALWADLPVLTRRGDTFAGRVAASVLTAIGLPELIARDSAEYEAIALDLARSPERLAALKAKLAANRATHPLFDTQRFTGHLEDLYVEMHRRAQAGEKPDHIGAVSGA